MDPKYQIFISSTYMDLVAEREEITKQILKAFHFPIGMEMFAASADRTWRTVEQTIDSSDIYVLVIGYRYGSPESDDEISFTEKEYDYAIAVKKPVIVFVKEDKKLVKEISRLSAKKPVPASLLDIYKYKYDQDQSNIERFKSKAMKNRLVEKFGDEGKIDIQSAIAKMIKDLPSGGWIRRANIHHYEPLLTALDLLGVYHIRASKPTPKDDEEKIRLFQESTEIKIIQYNGSRFFEIFKNEIRDFLACEGKRLKILLADKESVFYEENSKMVADYFSNHDANKNLVEYAKGRLQLAHDEAQKLNPKIKAEPDKLTIKHFNTQMRSPMVIFDDAICHLTLTYAPSESLQAFEIEMKKYDDSKGYLGTCLKHFDRIWEML